MDTMSMSASILFGFLATSAGCVLLPIAMIGLAYWNPPEPDMLGFTVGAVCAVAIAMAGFALFIVPKLK